MAKSEVVSPWLTVGECAVYMRRSKDKVTEWVKSGVLESHVEPGAKRGTLIHMEDVDALIRSWPNAATVPETLRT